ncbi:MAG TPA: ketoacyl-ACP synthase III [Thermoanaerobaculia bacterium]|nr:ketoacyl-ACP synthase III [Thermoanaerobaculia bacterium]
MSSSPPAARARAALQEIAIHLPEAELTNEQLAAETGWTAERILEQTGVRVRRIAAPGELASDLGVLAAEKLFATAACRREEVDFLLFCTQSPDYLLPTTACLVHARLGLRPDCGALDFNLGCSGFVYGLGLAKGLVESGAARRVLLVTAETYSKHIDPRDRSVRTIFGDGAAATLIGSVPGDEEALGPFVFGTDGRRAEDIIVRAGALRMPLPAPSAAGAAGAAESWRTGRELQMNGPEVFNFSLRAVPAAVDRLLQAAGLRRAEVDYFVFHQASRFMLEHLRRKLDIPPEKFCFELEGCGNTVSSTIPICLRAARDRGELGAGARVMVVGFGVGYSWAAGLLRWS